MRAVTRLYNQIAQTWTSAWRHSSSRVGHLIASTRRPKATLAGAFVLLIGGLTAGGSQLIGAMAGNSNASIPQTKATAHQANAGKDNTPGNDASTNQTTHSVSVSTNVDSSDPDSAPSTQVSVNGQPVNVPANGSVQKTTNDGNQQTNISVSQSTSGDADTSNHTHSSIHVYSNSSSDVDQEDSVSAH